MIGVEANPRKLGKLPAQDAQVGLESVSRDPYDARRVWAIVGAPVGRVVATVRGRLTSLERFPNALIGDAQSIHVT
jgi:hypothetical protein